MRYVVDSEMVAHLWANQSQDHARNRQGNFYFQGDTVFSYGSHFPVAKLYTKKGRTIALFTSRRYSSTTNRHQSMARRACGHTRITVADVYGKHGANLNELRSTIDELAKKATRARTNSEYLWHQCTATVSSANDYCEFFGLKTRFAAPTEDVIWLKIAAQKEQAKKAAARAERLRAEQLVKAREDMQAWIAGADVHAQSMVPEVYLRIKGDVLETSKGAEVPLAHALRLLPLVRSGKVYAHNGHSLHIGQFRVDSIDEQGNVRAGCHYIKREEIERVAAQLEAQEVKS